METEKNRKLKGSVLFTVVSVMALLIIFLTSTLVLASASNNRAHRSYSTSQAEYTARAAIMSFTEAMQRDANIAYALQDLSDPVYPTVVIGNSGTADTSLGRLVCIKDDGTEELDAITVSKVDGVTDYAYYDETPQTVNPDGSHPGLGWHPVDTIRVSATARVGKEEKTVTAYIKKAAGSATITPGSSTSITPGGVKGFQLLGDSNFPNGGYVYGGYGVGLKNTNHDSIYKLHNSTNLETLNTFINGSYNVGTGSLGINVMSNKSGTVVLGNMLIENTQFINIEYDMEKDLASESPSRTTFTQQDIPYIYIDGGLTTLSSLQIINTKTEPYENSSGTTKDPFNVFVGTWDTWGKAVSLDCDLYLMDTVSSDQYQIKDVGGTVQGTVTKGKNRLGGTSSTNLYKWTSSVVQETASTQFDSYGGSIYCNGDLELSLSTIEGDLRVEGDCTLENVTIKGNLIVGGNLTINGTVNCNGSTSEIYCNGYSGSGTLQIRGSDISSGTSYTLKPGYTQVENILMPQKQVPKSGYSTITNNAYYYNEVNVDMGGWSKFMYEDKWGNRYDSWDNRVLKDDPLGYYYYVETNAAGMEVGTQPIADEVSYYDAYGNKKQSWEATEWKPAYRVETDINGIAYSPEVETSDIYSYFDNTGASVTEAEAMDSVTVGINDPTGMEIYPASMTREAIFGTMNADGTMSATAPSATKLIRNLEEARLDNDLDAATGNFDITKYPTMPTKDVSKPAFRTDRSMNPDIRTVESGNEYISESCTIDNNMPYGEITIKPFSDIDIVLDNLDMITNNRKITVDTSAGGTVNFFVKGNLKMGNSYFVNKDLKNGDFDLTATYNTGMTFYSYAPTNTESSEIFISNGAATISGSFRMPLTAFNQAGGSGGQIGIHSYTDMFGNYFDDADHTKALPIIGTALFKELTNAQNGFGLYFCDDSSSGGSGGGGGGGGVTGGVTIATAAGYFDIGYFGEY